MNQVPGGADQDTMNSGTPDVEVQEFLGGTQVSYFENVFVKQPVQAISIGELLDNIKVGGWRRVVADLRTILATQGKDAYNEAKRYLPAVTLSGVISGQRKYAAEEGRLTHNGLLQCDFDQSDHTGLTLPQIRGVLESDPCCLACWTSPSGLGMKALVRVRESCDLHKGSFHAAEAHFAPLGLNLDEATKDAGRLCLVSDDPGLWINSKLPELIEPLAESATPEDAERDNDSEKDSSGGDVSIDDVREVLGFIPRFPGYEIWSRIAWAVFNSVGNKNGLALLMEWSQEDKPGEYAKLYGDGPPKSGKKVGFGTLVFYAKPHGYFPRPKVPADVIPLPVGGIDHSRSSRVIFKLAAKTNRVFIRGTTVVEIVRDSSRGAVITAVKPERFVEFVETLGKRIARRERVKSAGADGTKPENAKWRTDTMPLHVASIALQSQAARDLLPQLRQVVCAPIIVETGDRRCEILGEGYHPFGGGTFVAGGVKLEGPFGCAISASILSSLFADFDFATPSDLSRAMACMISPALKTGGILTCDFPLDFAEADQSQSGKTYRQKMTAALYNEIPSVITVRKGGVGSLDESVANALLAGRPFIAMDNIRGGIDSSLLETALRGHGHVDCRGFRANSRVDVTPFIWQMSTNGVELTRDLANRLVIVRIRKQPGGYTFKTYPQGDVLANINIRRGLYLSAVFDIVREWVARGKPQTDESRHDFREWTCSLDWIVRNLFGMPPLMDGHHEEQIRTANPNLQWLRSVVLAARPQDLGRPLTTTSVVSIAQEAGIEFPGGPNREKDPVRAGRILGSIFAAAGTDMLPIDGFVITKSSTPVVGEHGLKQQSRYTIEKP